MKAYNPITGHTMRGRMSGSSGIITICECGKVFYGEYPDLFSNLTLQQREDATAQADDRYQEHVDLEREWLNDA
jgi:hypothetical protein